jgi:hypothetical protein
MKIRSLLIVAALGSFADRLGHRGLVDDRRKMGCLRNGIEKILARSSQRQDEAASTVPSRPKRRSKT